MLTRHPGSNVFYGFLLPLAFMQGTASRRKFFVFLQREAAKMHPGNSDLAQESGVMKIDRRPVSIRSFRYVYKGFPSK